jgi:hypothetical protein
MAGRRRQDFVKIWMGETEEGWGLRVTSNMDALHPSML